MNFITRVFTSARRLVACWRACQGIAVNPNDGSAQLLQAQNTILLYQLKKATEALSGGLWDYGPGQDEHEKCQEVIDECREVIAIVEAASL